MCEPPTARRVLPFRRFGSDRHQGANPTSTRIADHRKRVGRFRMTPRASRGLRRPFSGPTSRPFVTTNMKLRLMEVKILSRKRRQFFRAPAEQAWCCCGRRAYQELRCIPGSTGAMSLAVACPRAERMERIRRIAARGKGLFTYSVLTGRRRLVSIRVYNFD